MRTSLFTMLLFIMTTLLHAQETDCSDKAIKHTIQSKYLGESRHFWVSLPFRYTDTLNYPVIYVLDSEWRFNLVKNIAFDLGANDKISNSIIVGIPHVEMRNKRGVDLTFSHSRIEYDGQEVDSTTYNSTNSGEGFNFYNYITHELIPNVNQIYSTNNHETLIGHSYGGYFGGYILSLENPFDIIHMYDPSVWYSHGEVIQRFVDHPPKSKTQVYLTYQPFPSYHKLKIEQFIQVLESSKLIDLKTKLYKEETHNSLFLASFYQGILITQKM